jgi:hypothetical protein
MSVRSRIFPWFALCTGMALTSSAVAREAADDDEPFLPGLMATFRDANGHTATRLDAQPAFHWGETPPDPRLSAGEFRAVWQGHLYALPRGLYRFHVYGCGEIELKIAGRVAIARQTVRDGWVSSEPLTLTADYHPLELSFRRVTETPQPPTGERLPLPADIMPTGLCWRPDGRLIFCSLCRRFRPAIVSRWDWPSTATANCSPPTIRATTSRSTN